MTIDVLQHRRITLRTNLYSRQIGIVVIETRGKLIQMQTCIVSLRGLGVESALVLASVLVSASPNENFVAPTFFGRKPA